MTDSARKQELLEAAYAYVLGNGLADMSLRPLAREIGSSPRVLLFLFGTKEELIRALLARAREEELRYLAALRDEHNGLAATGRDVWSWLADPSHRSLLALWVEGYARSLLGEPGPWADFGRDTVRDWLDLLAQRQAPPDGAGGTSGPDGAGGPSGPDGAGDSGGAGSAGGSDSDGSGSVGPVGPVSSVSPVGSVGPGGLGGAGGAGGSGGAGGAGGSGGAGGAGGSGGAGGAGGSGGSDAEAEAEAERTLLLAVLRGALLDLLATGDVARVTAAVERHLRTL